MGFLDELKDKAEEFGDKTQERFGAAKDESERSDRERQGSLRW